MWLSLVFLTFASILVAEQPAARSDTPPPYPDLSEPKASAFSLAVALNTGDVKTARAVYTGKQELFLEYLDALAKTRAKADRLQEAITKRFGGSGWTAFGRPFRAELKMKVGEKDKSEAPLTVVIAVAKVKQKGDEATLELTKDIKIELKKSAAEWKVTNWPGPSPLGFLTTAFRVCPNRNFLPF